MLRGLDIAGHHRAGIGGFQHRAFGDDDVDRPQAAGIHRDRLFHHHPEGIEHGCAGHRFRRIEIVLARFRRAGEIDCRFALLAIDGDLHADRLACVGLVGIFGIGELLQDTRHALGSVVLNVAHIGFHNIEPEIGDHFPEVCHTLFVGGDLRLQVGDVLGNVADRVGVVGQKLFERLFPEAPLVDDLEVVDQHAFLVDGRCERRHRARRRSADIRVVPTRCCPEQDLGVRTVREDRCDHSDVGQMCPAIIGRVESVDVTGFDLAFVEANDRFHRTVHRAQMHRHVGRIGDKGAVTVEDGAGEVEPLLDVDRVGGVLQRHAHLFGDRHEEVVEDFEQYRVGLVGADRHRPVELLVPGQYHVVAGIDLGSPARFDDDGLVGLDHHCRALHPIAGLQALPSDDPGIVPRAS